MKVNIGPYRKWFGPYQLSELLCFWVSKKPDEYGVMEKPEWVHKFGEWLAHGSIQPERTVGEIFDLKEERPETKLYKFLKWVDRKKKRKIKVKIHDYDLWNMDYTLALVIYPMLLKLKETKHGSPLVDDEDVPENIRKVNAKPVSDYETDEFFEARWNYVLDEIIFAFKNTVDDSWEEQFGELTDSNLTGKVIDADGTVEVIQDPNKKETFDWEGYKAYGKRIQNGFRLFGKYYSALWT